MLLFPAGPDPAVQDSSTGVAAAARPSTAAAAARPSTAAASSHLSVVSSLHSPADQHSSSFEGKLGISLWQALSKTLTVDELFYLKEQFALLQPSKNGTISLENIKEALMRNGTDAMKESRAYEFLTSLNPLQYRRMDFEEFCAAALSVHQLEALDRWEQHARCAYELFEKDGNRPIMIE
ncbi:hypothetical protein Ancab_034150 [Ancistrocladus abbreviatus]